MTHPLLAVRMRRGEESTGLRFPFLSPPEPGGCLEVAPGILWLRLPLPFALDHINVYLVEDGAGWAVIDTGINSGLTRDAWNNVIANQLSGRPLTRVVATHFHPDHVGLAGWLTERFEVPLWMSQTEYFFSLSRQLDHGEERAAAYQKFYERGELPSDIAYGIVSHGAHYVRSTSPLPASYRRLMMGDALPIGSREFEVSTGGGHAAEQLMLLSRRDRLFFSADQVLAKITPNISVWPVEPEADSLKLFLDSLATLAATIPEDVLVLPGHILPFYGLHHRIRELQEHHALRCDEVSEICRESAKSIAEISSAVFKKEFDIHQMSFAFGEMAAHVNYLVRRGVLQVADSRDGILRYERTK